VPDEWDQLAARNESRRRTRRGPPVPLTLCIAQFLRFYGPGLYYASHWPTPSGTIPHRLFWVLLRRMWAVKALERVQHTRAARLARVRDKALAERLARDESADAWPER
jgi:hypothetical protein